MYICAMQMNALNYKVTVVIHAFNHENYISDCLESVLLQDALEDMKVLIIDDASTDDTLEICKTFQRKHQDKIEILPLQVNELSQGLFVGFDRLKKIESEFIAWCDGDDYWTDNSKIRKQIEILEKYSKIGIVHTNYEFIRKVGEEFIFEDRKEYEIAKSKGVKSGKDFINGNHIKHSTCMILRSAIDFDFVGSSKGIYACDWLICISALRKFGVFYMNDKTTIARITEKGVWNGSSNDRNNDQKSKIRWHCAANLPNSKLRYLFIRRVFLDWIRSGISKSPAYPIVRPIVFRFRRIKIKKIVNAKKR